MRSGKGGGPDMGPGLLSGDALVPASASAASHPETKTVVSQNSAVLPRFARLVRVLILPAELRGADLLSIRAPKRTCLRA